MAENQESRKPVILAVDDTEANLDVLLETLDEDYEVAVAMDGPAALSAVADSPPDLILLDIMMPGMDGYEVCRQLRANPATRDIPVIFITAMSDTDDEAKGFGLGAVDYITKPISPPIVQARVKTHLALRRAYLDLARQHEELKEYARLRDEVERISRHDLKTPLNAIITVPEMLLEELQLSPDQRDLLMMLKQSGFRMLQMINSSLDLYKMETGRYRFNPAPVNLIPLLEQIAGELSEMMLGKSLRMQITLDGRPLARGQGFWVAGEEMLLYSMLANLIKNAVEASPDEQLISVHLTGGEQAQVKIHNQGAVPAQLRSHFFDKFATAGKEGGTGLGTYAARLITQTMGGEISYATDEQTGTVVAVKLASAPGEPAEALAAESGSQPKSVRLDRVFTDKATLLQKQFHQHQQAGMDTSILVVDDYSNMRRLTKSVLRRMGYGDIHEAVDGEKALAVLRGTKINLIISDVNMPKVSGIELLNAVRGDPATASVPFIIITGEADKNTVLAAAKAKVTAYLIKPFSPDALQAKIEVALGRGK